MSPESNGSGERPVPPEPPPSPGVEPIPNDKPCVGAFIVSPEDDTRRAISFELQPRFVGNVPEDQAALRNEVDKTVAVLRMMFPESNAQFKEYYNRLLGLARVGLVCQWAQPALATQALAMLKEQIVAQEGGRIKNRYMRSLGFWCLFSGLTPLLFVHLLNLRYGELFGEVFVNFLFLWCGSMAGLWLSFGARKKIMRFEDLHVLEEDHMEPLVRLAFAGLLTIMIGLLFSTKTVAASFGEVDSSQFVTNPQVALLLGMICGFSEQVLPTKLAHKAGEILKF